MPTRITAGVQEITLVSLLLVTMIPIPIDCKITNYLCNYRIQEVHYDMTLLLQYFNVHHRL